MNWIQLTLNFSQRRSLVNMIINIRILEKARTVLNRRLIVTECMSSMKLIYRIGVSHSGVCLSTLKLEAIYSFEMSLEFQQTTRNFGSENRTLYVVSWLLNDCILCAISKNLLVFSHCIIVNC